MKNINYISTSHLNSSKNKKKKLNRPNWIKVKAPQSKNYLETTSLIDKLNLNTVCKAAACPNIGECWDKKHATIMILGNVCTRKCTFCNILTGVPNKVDINEPLNVAKAINSLNLKHVVITSVDRDDLVDGGANHFSECIKEIRNLNKKVTIEILTPDFQRKKNAMNIIVKAIPDVFNHNLETIPRLYKEIRKGANYAHSLSILNYVKEKNARIWTKSGLMLGLGESIDEVFDVLDNMRQNKVDFLTVGQYLQPTDGHQKLKKYYTLEEFKFIEDVAWEKGFKMVSCTPLTRSSYHADEHFEKLKAIHA